FPRLLPVERRFVLHLVKPRSQLGGGSSELDDDFIITAKLLSLYLAVIVSVNVGSMGIASFGVSRDKGMSYRAKSAGSGDSTSSGERICKCGLVAQMKVSNSEANPGREYFSCPDGKCRWFR
ncbi:hypothetical protein PIB30_066065, partial [Stylosanthes scabra]|nr:hypothetical protein [Stylosanthes scabra]